MRRVSADWRRHRSLVRYFEAGLPRIWPEMQTCDNRFLVRGQDYPKQRFKVVSLPCRQLPFCFRCAEKETNRRVQQAFNALHACKPAKKPPLMFHMVQTAPYLVPGPYDPELYGPGWPTPTDPEGWGVLAARDVDAFFRVVWDACVDFFGPGIGGRLSYQDFGSYGPRKLHPHIDFTLNGWRLLDGKAIPLRVPDLRRGDLQRWQRIVEDHARTLGGPYYRNPGHVFFGQRFDNFQSYHGVMAYQLREMWDFSVISHPAPRTLRWHSYKGGWHDYDEGDFYARMTEYQRRFGRWGQHQAATLHRSYGHMAKGQLERTMKAMGGTERRHKAFCVCNVCQEWYPIVQVRRPGDPSRDAILAA